MVQFECPKYRNPCKISHMCFELSYVRPLVMSDPDASAVSTRWCPSSFKELRETWMILAFSESPFFRNFKLDGQTSS